ncbi:hypothetical protein PVL30_004712 [Lodderomyces elongisporus]|uniref:uncharacterized protein n=1 Tax=Lodderomyces elongisporus TaxID=36914 RepID=UPI00291CA8FC|nr:uncharacterized protein PVL30_004712 [Lodderomyces elongisporus]WLF80919.1 hypothetical protein PVL30_004712 [Lodderomyces elongisporus]
MLAKDASTSKRLIQCICAITWVLLSGGPIFGFAALKPVLIQSGIYESLCDVENASSDLVGSAQVGLAKCTKQDLKLNMLFTVAAVLTNVSALPVGRVLDVYGPKVGGLVGAFFLYCACLTFIYADSLIATLGSWVDPYLFGYCFLALGGPFAFISSFQLSNAFPAKSGTILALLTGAFDASSAVFLFYRWGFDYFSGDFSLQKFFSVYLLVPVFITVAQLTLMPSESYFTDPSVKFCHDDDDNNDNDGNGGVEEEEEEEVVARGHYSQPREDSIQTNATESSPLLSSNGNAFTEAYYDQQVGAQPKVFLQRRDSIGDALKQPYVNEGEEYLEEHTGGVFGILHGYSAQYQIRTYWFILICMFSTVQMLRLNYFVTTIGSQYEYIFQSYDKAESLNRYFDLALPLAGIIATPFIGLLLDHSTTELVVFILFVISLVIGVLGLFSNYALAVVGVTLFVGYRPFFYTVISDVCAKVFGFETFGTVYGLLMCICGAMNSGQGVLDGMTHNVFNMNPYPVNIFLLCTTIVIGSITVWFVKSEAEKYRRKKSQSNGSLHTGSG